MAARHPGHPFQSVTLLLALPPHRGPQARGTLIGRGGGLGGMYIPDPIPRAVDMDGVPERDLEHPQDEFEAPARVQARAKSGREARWAIASHLKRGQGRRAGRPAATAADVMDPQLQRHLENIEHAVAHGRATKAPGPASPAPIEGARSPCPTPAFEGGTSQGSPERPAAIDDLDGLPEEVLEQLENAAATRRWGRGDPLKRPPPLAATTPPAGAARCPGLEEGASLGTPASTKRARLQYPPDKNTGDTALEAITAPRTVSAPNGTASAPDSVYVLRLATEGCFYVGHSRDIHAREQQHRKEPNAFIRAKGGVIGTVDPVTLPHPEVLLWEQMETVVRMMQFGFNNVRGWEFTDAANLPKEQLNMVKVLICGNGDLCRKCGKSGHFEAQCPGDGAAEWLQNFEDLISAAALSEGSPATAPERPTNAGQSCRAMIQGIAAGGSGLQESSGAALQGRTGARPRTVALTFDRRSTGRFATMQGSGTFHLRQVLKDCLFSFSGPPRRAGRHEERGATRSGPPLWTWRPEQSLSDEDCDETFLRLETTLRAAAEEKGIELEVTRV